MAHHSHKHSDSSSKNISVAFFLNLCFAIFELIGGFLTNSVAILSDAIHDLGDSFALGFSWYLQKKSNKKSDAQYSYGYKRFSLLGAIIISVVLVISSAFILVESFKRLMNPQATDAQGMILFAIVGIAVNGYAAFRLHKGTSLNERAVSLHLLEDVFGWVAVLIAGIIMSYVDLPIIDPILSIGIVVWVLINVYKNLKSALRVLLQEVPENVNVHLLLVRVKELPNVINIHDFHLWSLDGERNIMTLHIVTDTHMEEDISALKQNIRAISDSFNISHVTLEIETEKEFAECRYRFECE